MLELVNTGSLRTYSVSLPTSTQEYMLMQEHPFMDGKNLGVSFLISFLLVGSGLFLVAQDSVEEDPSENAEDTSSIEKILG